MKISVDRDKQTRLLKTVPEPRESDGRDASDRNYEQSIKLARWEDYARQILRFLPAGPKVLLDVGCGPGCLVGVAQRDFGFMTTGIDVSPLAIAFAKKNYPGCSFFVSSLETWRQKRPADVVVLNHVLEHISQIDSFLDHCGKLLSPGGYLLIASPNFASLMRLIFQARWYGWQPSQHVWQLTRADICRWLQTRGWQVELATTISLDYDPPNRLKRLAFGLLTRLAESFGIGDQLVVIARKG